MPKEILKSIIKSGIVIPWDHSNEYIEIDLENIDESSSISQTYEDWYIGTEGENGGGDAKWVQYEPKSRIEKLNHHEIKISLNYSKNEKAIINDSGIPWGTSEIILNLKTLTGTATFNDIGDPNANEDSRESDIIVITKLESETQCKNVTQTQRDQKFRDTILSLDKRCIITGEKFKKVLDSAHIKAVKDGGREILSNGITLRADLHRLYDAGSFIISPSGNIQVIDDISQYYLDLLTGKSIPEGTLTRVHDMLLELA